MNSVTPEPTEYIKSTRHVIAFLLIHLGVAKILTMDNVTDYVLIVSDDGTRVVIADNVHIYTCDVVGMISGSVHTESRIRYAPLYSEVKYTMDE